jgi:hypothetical protein
VAVVLNGWHQQHFPLGDVLEGLAVDRRALAKFACRPAAQQIEDYLRLMSDDLEAVEQTARALASWDEGPWWRRPYPTNLVVGVRYDAG